MQKKSLKKPALASISKRLTLPALSHTMPHVTVLYFAPIEKELRRP